MTGDKTAVRLGALAIVALSLFGALVARLWVLQVVSDEEYVATAEGNRIRTVHVQAPRGRILDRQQRVLVDNREARRVTIDRALLDDAVADAGDQTDRDEAEAQIVTRLVDVLVRNGVETSFPEVMARLDDQTVAEFVPVPVAEDISEELVVSLLERQDEFPGVGVDRVTIREYPHGTLGAHVLGYVGALSEEDLTRIEDEGNLEDKPYGSGDEIGKTGVEASMENHLRGQPGQITYEVDRNGNVVRQIDAESFPPVPGDDIVLNLDIRVQQLLEDELAAQAQAYEISEAAAVVLDPEDGSVVAMASYPPFNPADSVGGFSTAQFDRLTAEGSGNPLQNKAISGQYPAASTFKLVSAMAGLEYGIVGPTTTITDTGEYTVEGCENTDESAGCTFRDAFEEPLGSVDLRTSLTKSSDVYYYRIGDHTWIQRDRIGEDGFQQVARRWGFDADTGVDLVGEQDGRIPDPESRREAYEANPDLFLTGDWFTGDNVNMAIGQGDVAVTPIQLANAYAAFANGGALYQPQVTHQVLRPARTEWTVVEEFAPETIRTVELPPVWRQPMMSGFLGVTRSSQGGTAGTAFEGFNLDAYPVGGKTGTGQNGIDPETGEERPDTTLFTGFGPVLPNQVPDYVVTAVFDRSGGFAGDIAAPMVRRVFDALADPTLQPNVAAQQATPNVGRSGVDTSVGGGAPTTTVPS